MKVTRILSSLVVVALAITACASTTGGGGTSTKKIALLLPETKTARYESKDRPLFEAKVKALCSDCQIIYSNANQDAPTQQSQAEAALTNGAKVLVLDPVDGAAAAAIANKAKQSNVPVISYDRLILNSPNVNYYISFDNAGAGKLQGTALLTALNGKASASVAMINGDPADNNAKLSPAGGRPRQRHRGAQLDDCRRCHQQHEQGRPLGSSQARRGDEGQRQDDSRRRQVLDRRRYLHGPVRGGLHGSRHLVVLFR